MKTKKLLGTIVSSDLTWWENTNFIVKKAYQRLEIIRKLYEFNVPVNDLVQIYTLYVRSILEFNCCVWTFNITKGQANDIERVQKIACKIILKENYTSYEAALTTLDLQNLVERRKTLALTFAKNCLKHEQTKDMFPLNDASRSEEYQVSFARHSRLVNSAIPQMQRLLNSQQ